MQKQNLLIRQMLRLQNKESLLGKCVNGHEYTIDNTYFEDGRPRCRICSRDRVKRFREKHPRQAPKIYPTNIGDIVLRGNQKPLPGKSIIYRPADDPGIRQAAKITAIMNGHLFLEPIQSKVSS